MCVSDLVDQRRSQRVENLLEVFFEVVAGREFAAASMGTAGRDDRLENGQSRASGSRLVESIPTLS